MKSSVDPAAASSSAEILLVDDNVHGLVARRRVLEEIGYQVHVAESGEQALALLPRLHVSLIVTDYKMDGMNGLELIRKVRETRPEIRLVLLSGFTGILGFDEASTGADAVLTKCAAELPQLTRTVKQLLALPRKRKPSCPQTRKPRLVAQSFL